MNKLLKIIYGEQEFSKVPYEARIRFLEDEVFLEKSKDVLYELKFKLLDLLKNKHSNLIRAVNDPKRKLKKSDVFNLIKSIESVINGVGLNVEDESKNVVVDNLDLVKKEDNFVENRDESNGFVYNDISYDFKKSFELRGDLNLVDVKNVTNFCIESLKNPNYNFIFNFNDKLGKIIFRKLNDNLVNLGSSAKDSVEIVYKKLVGQGEKNQVKDSLNLLREKEEISDKELKKEDDGYYEIGDDDKKFEQSKFEQDNSLEEKISSQVDESSLDSGKKIEFDSKTKVDDNQDVEFEKGEMVEIEHKDLGEKQTYELYDDEKIKVVLEEKSPSGIIDIIPKTDSLEDFNYGLIFSKYLAGLIFETLKCQGTNIVSQGDRFRVFPRFAEDNLIDVKHVQVNQDKLNQIYNKITSGLIPEEKQEEKVISMEQAGLVSQKIDSKEKVDNDDSKEDMKKKADILLDKLRRIP